MNASSSVQGAHPLRGALLLLAAVFLFACMDTTTKVLAADYAPAVVVAVRYIVHALLMLVLLAPTRGRQLVQTQRTGLVLVRAGCLAAASLLMALALQRLPVAEATAIMFVAPLLVMLLAAGLLKERVGLPGVLAAIGGFSGVLMIARPGGTLDGAGVGLALGAACMVASYQLLSRALVTTERTITLLFYAAMVGSIFYGLVAPWFWEGRPPSPLQALLFLSMGVMGGLGHFLFTAAHRHAPASVLAPMMYVQLLWAGLLGWLVFGHVSSGIDILGMGIVAACGVLVALNARREQRAFVAPAPD